MKVLSGLMLFVLCGVYASAQQDAKVIAEIAAGSEKLVKNSPFSAEAVSESVQMLYDGNRIVRSSTGKMYRNSEGRFRREMARGQGGMFGTMFSYGHGISILDPVGGYRYMIDSHMKTARQMVLRPPRVPRVRKKRELTETEKAEVEEKLKTAKAYKNEANAYAVAIKKANAAELKTDGYVMAVPALPPMPPPPAAMTIGPGAPVPMWTDVKGKFESRTEELGSRDFEGVSAEGKRTITTIPADAIGNERPIEVTYERWYSKELELVVYSKHSDPRFGEQTYRLTNIVRSEPDPSLFTLPSGYKIVADPGKPYRITTARGETIKAIAPSPAKPATVEETKP